MSERSILEDWVKSLNEDDFREKVLIPIFKALKYNDVINYHGGVRELGKDIVMWKRHEFHNRENYAVVVKVGKISGSVTGSNSFITISSQVRQALGTTYKNEVTAKDEKINYCWIAVNNNLKKDSLHALEAELKEYFDKGIVSIFSFNKIIKCLIKYKISPTNIDDLLISFKKIQGNEYIKSLTMKNDNEYSIELGKNIPKEYLTGNFSINYLKDKKGLEILNSFKDFIAHGSTVEIPKEYIKDIQHPKILQLLNPNMQYSSVDKIVLGYMSNETYILDFIIINKKDIFKLERLEFKKIASGKESSTILCDSNDLIFTIQFRFNKDFSVNINYTLKDDISKFTVYEMKIFYDFLNILYNGGKIELLESKTKQRIFKIDFTEKSIPKPNEETYDIFLKANYIQEKTNCLFYIPENGFTISNYKDIQELHKIIYEGYRNDLTGIFSGIVEESEYFTGKESNEFIQELGLYLVRDEKIELLGNTIDIGQVIYIIKKGILKFNEIKNNQIEFSITTNKDCPVTVFYNKYYQGTKNKEINKKLMYIE